MIKITLEFANVDEAIVALGKLTATVGKPTTIVKAEASDKKIVPEVAKTKGRPKKEAKPVEKTEPKAETPPEPAAASGTPDPAPIVATYDEAQAALEALFNAKGITVALDVLKKFNGAQRLRDLKLEEFAPFIEAAKEAQK